MSQISITPGSGTVSVTVTDPTGALSLFSDAAHLTPVSQPVTVAKNTLLHFTPTSDSAAVRTLAVYGDSTTALDVSQPFNPHQHVDYICAAEYTGTADFPSGAAIAKKADSTSVAGHELAAVILATSSVFAITANAYVDVTGMTISPVIGTRGIYIDLDVMALSTVTGAQINFQLFDVTANAAVPGVLGIPTGTSPTAANGFRRWRLAPAAGARAYKLQVTQSSNGNVELLGSDLGINSGMYVVER